MPLSFPKVEHVRSQTGYKTAWDSGCPYSKSGDKIIDTKKRGFGSSLEESVSPRAFHRSKHLIVLLFERASRCYELGALTLDVFPECFEQRDALGSSDEFSEVVWF